MEQEDTSARSASIVLELQLGMLEAVAPHASYCRGALLLEYAVAMMTREQRQRLGRFWETLAAATAADR